MTIIEYKVICKKVLNILYNIKNLTYIKFIIILFFYILTKFYYV
jgi:hypothetical protein